MPDDPKRYLWAMKNTEDLLRLMWEQGEFERLGIAKGEDFDLARADDAFRRYWEQKSAELGNRAFWGVPPNDPEVSEYVNAIRSGTLESYLEEKDTNEIVNLYSKTINVMSETGVYNTDLSELDRERVPSYAESYVYLQALEMGETLPFSPEFDPYLLRNYAAQAYGSLGGYVTVEDYEDLPGAILADLAHLLPVILGNVDASSELYFLANIARREEYPGAFPQSFLMPPPSYEESYGQYNAMLSVIQTVLPANYTAEEIAALNYWIAYEAFQDLPEGDIMLRQELLARLSTSGLFLEAAALDTRRQELYLSNAALVHLNETINAMPSEIIGISVGHIKQAFLAFYQGMANYLAEDEMGLLSIEQIPSMELRFEELAPDSQGLSWIIELAASTLLEPVDWMLSARDLAKGDCWALTTFIPFVPGLGRMFDDIFGFSDEMIEGGRWLDYLEVPDFSTCFYKATSSPSMGGGMGGVIFDINPHEEAVLRNLGFGFSQEEIDRLLALSTDFDTRGNRALGRIIPAEGASAMWAEKERSAELGVPVKLTRSKDTAFDWLDDTAAKSTYDAVRGYHGPHGSYSFNEQAFRNALGKHERDGLNFVIIDVTGLSAADITRAKAAAADVMKTWKITPMPQILWQEP